MKVLLSTVLLSALILSGCAAVEGGGAKAAPEPALEAPTGDEAAITGTITDDSFQPIAGATVALLKLEPPLETVSDEAGRFVLNHVPVGTHALAAQKLGYESVVRNIDVGAGETKDVSLTLPSVPIAQDQRHITLIGEGYFACGAYLVITSWGNLHACVWDNHKPRYVFEADETDLMGILQEVVWKPTSGVTSEYLAVRLQYGEPVCDPFCSEDDMYADETGRSPVRIYSDMEGKLDKKGEAGQTVHRLTSLTFPDGEDTPVLVFQQRMTHYVTIFWGDHCVAGGDGEDCPPEVFTAIPDA